MTLLTRGDHKFAEDADDLRTWLQQLPTPDSLTETAVLGCPQHGDESPPTWSYVEADAAAGVARRRCLSCAHSVPLFDSEDRWTFPAMWACMGCGGSIAELAAGMHVSDDRVSWLVLGARCVGCGRVSGLTDLVVPGLPLADVVAAL